MGMVGPQDKEGWDAQLFEFYKFVFSPFHSDEPFAFKPWFDDPRMKGFMDGVSYQNAEWAKQEAVKYDDSSVRVVDPTLTLPWWFCSSGRPGVVSGTRTPRPAS